MLATHTVRSATGLDAFRPSIIRIHEMPVSSDTSRTLYAPALSFPQQVTTEQAINALREMRVDNDSIYYLFVTDYHEHLVGVVSLRQLIVAPPTARLFEVMDQRLITLPPDATLEEQADLMSKTGLLALPIVDEEGRLVGAVDTNDLIEALKDEATEGMYQLAGVCKHDHMNHPLVNAAGDRVVSLMVSLFGIFLAAWIISLYQNTIAQVAILAAFIPIVTSPGKIAGTQTLTFVVRSLMLGNVRLPDAKQVFSRELIVGVTNGLCLGAAVGCITWVWQSNALLGLIAGLATLLSLLIAVVVGVVIPMMYKTLRINPACASEQFVSAITTLCALGIFLGMSVLATQMGYL